MEVNNTDTELITSSLDAYTVVWSIRVKNPMRWQADENNPLYLGKSFPATVNRITLDRRYLVQGVDKNVALWNILDRK